MTADELVARVREAMKAAPVGKWTARETLGDGVVAAAVRVVVEACAEAAKNARCAENGHAVFDPHCTFPAAHVIDDAIRALAPEAPR